MSDLLSDRVAVITGAASGIGREMALTFAAHGADIVVADIREDPRQGGDPTHERIAAETDGDAIHVNCDVRDVGDLSDAVDAAGEFGGLDVMVNNAGIFRTEAFVNVTEDEYDRLMDVNVKGTFFGAQAAADRMDEGTIINLSSVAGLQGSATFTTYCASKGAVRLMTYALASELGPDIRVNALHPGIIETSMTTEDVPLVGGTMTDDEARQTIPSARFGRPGDVADAAVFLASDLSGYVTGSSLPVDGGLAFASR